MRNRKKYVIDELLVVVGMLFTANIILLVVAICAGLSHVALIGLLLLAVGLTAVGICFFHICLKHYRETEKLMNLYATEYIIEDLCHIDCFLSRGAERAMKKALALLDTPKLLNVSKRQAQYLALQNQINPHFLYNTLEGIRSEAMVAGLDLVADMTEALAKFFRYTISRLENLVAVADEIENVQTYFSIQQFRFGERLQMEIVCPEDRDEINACLIPKLTLQPIVENAIIHGLESKTERGVIRIILTLTQQRLLIMVSDNGVGMEEETLHHLQEQLSKTAFDYIENRREKGGGIALQNVNNRIRLLFGEEYGINICSTPGIGTDVCIALPSDTSKAKAMKREGHA